MVDKIYKAENDWRTELSPAQYAVCRCHETEPPFSGIYTASLEDGIYTCVCCDQVLFDSKNKFVSGCGWPSYAQPIAKEYIIERIDKSHGMVRMEVLCSRCEAHLGHVFNDGPKPTGLRYCINSIALNFKKRCLR